MQKKVSRIGVLTSGGDSPGMNAAIRAVVRTGIYNGLEVYGIMRGYQGLLEDDIFKMESRSVANIIQRGGTILKTARCKDFLTPEGRQKGYDILKARGIEGLVVIGGDGSFQGAIKFSQEFDIPVIGIAGTIDKDIFGTDFTIGFDTAVNTAVSAIDKIRDTADAHDRLFIVEVMGRDAGYIALHSGIATGAENILVPEQKTNIEAIISSLAEKERRKKLVNIIVVAEGDESGGAEELAKIIKARLPLIETRVTILGHIQRGGTPTAYDRIIGTQFGIKAVDLVKEGKFGQMVSLQDNKLRSVALEEAVEKRKTIDMDLYEVAKVFFG